MTAPEAGKMVETGKTLQVLRALLSLGPPLLALFLALLFLFNVMPQSIPPGWIFEAPLLLLVLNTLFLYPSNFAKHGKGNLLELSLLKSDNTLHLKIQDNGQGFDVEKVPKGLGLESMRERVELSGGPFHIESVEGKGTTIRASWSLGGNV
jgi:hypothetical protein